MTLTAAGCALTAGCSASPTPTKTVTVTATVTSTTTVTASPSPTPTTSGADTKPLAIGAVLTLSDATASVVGFNDNPRGQAQTGERYAALQVKVCVNAGGPVGPGAWSLVGTDGGFYSEIVSGGGLQQPEYSDTTVAVGGCATGWISFDLPAATKVVQARYTPTKDDGTQVIALWALS